MQIIVDVETRSVHDETGQKMPEVEAVIAPGFCIPTPEEAAYIADVVIPRIKAEMDAEAKTKALKPAVLTRRPLGKRTVCR